MPMTIKRVFLRNVPTGTKFLHSDGVYYRVISPENIRGEVMCRDSVFNQVWPIKGGAVVTVRL